MMVLSAAIPILILLAAAVLLVAGAGTVSSASVPRAPAIAGRRGETATAAVRLTCPETKRLTEVRLGALPGAAGPRLTVLSCERFAEGEVLCEQPCLRPVAA